MARVVVGISFVLLVVDFSFTLVFCNSTDQFVNSCTKNNAVVDYDEYETLKSSSCNCTDHNRCIRKCCQFGFFHNFTRDNNSDAKCIRNGSIAISDFTVSLYEGTVKKTETDIFIIGMLNCNNSDMSQQYFKMNNWDPNERYFLQTNGTLYFPNSHSKFYKNDRYCVDEEDGLTVYLCYTPENPQRKVGRLVNSAGETKYFQKFFRDKCCFDVIARASTPKEFGEACNKMQ